MINGVETRGSGVRGTGLLFSFFIVLDSFFFLLLFFFFLAVFLSKYPIHPWGRDR